VSGALRPVRLGHLGDAGRAELVELAAAARRSHDWGPLADRLVRLRAWEVPVAALSAVVGVGESRLRVLCRDHGPDPAAVGDPLADAGWVDTATAARAVVGVSVDRLLAHTARAEADGVAVMAGWTRLWHGHRWPGGGPRSGSTHARLPGCGGTPARTGSTGWSPAVRRSRARPRRLG